MLKKCGCIFLALSIILALAACSGEKVEQTTVELATQTAGEAADNAEKQTDKNSGSKEDTQMEYPKVLVKMKDGGEFTIELYPQFAPKTVENFLKLVNEGFYNGLTFHRVYAGFMAQGGDPKGDGTGGSKDKIFGEFAANGFTQNTLSHTRGVVSMARSAQNNSASSQFFICYSDACTQLDGSYAAFGMVTDGMEVVDSFCNREMTYNSMREKASPVEPIIIDSMTEIQ